jgi:hypothetical protein
MVSKEPPLDIVSTFLRRFGHPDGGPIRIDQGRKVARSPVFIDKALHDHNYTVMPIGTDSPSQNGAVKIYNNKMAIRVRTLLHGLGLPAQY